jgi:hypothetical protein
MNCQISENEPDKGEIIVYQTDDGRVRLDVRLQDETVWLTQQSISELFQTTVPNISMHIRNIFKEGELTPEATVKNFLTVRREGRRNVRRVLEFYNLDMVKLTKQEAEDHAKSEYERFAVRRRKYKEALGEADYLKQLEEAAKQVSGDKNGL